MKINNSFVLGTGFAILLGITLTPLTIWAAQEFQEGDSMKGNVGKNINYSQASEVEQYWTPERMQNAQPLMPKRPGFPQAVPQPQPLSEPEVSAPSSSEVSEEGSSWTVDDMENAQPLTAQRSNSTAP